MKSHSTPDAARTLGALLRRPYERMADWLYAELAQRGYPDVRVAHSAVLRNLPAGGARVTDLAIKAGMTKQSMAYLVEQMESLGYVQVQPDDNDRRAKIVRFTARGEALVREAVTLSRQYEDRIGQMIGARRLEQLRATLADLYDKLD